MCAASPARKQRPLEKRLRLARMEAVDRGALDADADRRRTRARAAAAPTPAAPSLRAARPGCSMNSQRWRPPGATMCGVGRRGSQMNSTVVDRVRHVERIDDQPVLGEGAALEVQAERAPHQRVRAVGADQVARAHLALRAVGVLQPGVDEVGRRRRSPRARRRAAPRRSGCCASFARSSCSSSGW